MSLRNFQADFIAGHQLNICNLCTVDKTCMNVPNAIETECCDSKTNFSLLLNKSFHHTVHLFDKNMLLEI